jgi:hypothetical protein
MAIVKDTPCLRFSSVYCLHKMFHPISNRDMNVTWLSLGMYGNASIEIACCFRGYL